MTDLSLQERALEHAILYQAAIDEEVLKLIEKATPRVITGFHDKFDGGLVAELIKCDLTATREVKFDFSRGLEFTWHFEFDDLKWKSTISTDGRDSQAYIGRPKWFVYRKPLPT